MGTGYLLGGIACILYFVWVGIAGGIRRSPTVLKFVKLKLGKNMSDEKAAKISLIVGIVVGLAGVFLLVFGAIQG